jgi:hypothetical protein
MNKDEKINLLLKFIKFYEKFYKNGNPYEHLPVNSDIECIIEFIESNWKKLK